MTSTRSSWRPLGRSSRALVALALALLLHGAVLLVASLLEPAVRPAPFAGPPVEVEIRRVAPRPVVAPPAPEPPAPDERPEPPAAEVRLVERPIAPAPEEPPASEPPAEPPPDDVVFLPAPRPSPPSLVPPSLPLPPGDAARPGEAPPSSLLGRVVGRGTPAGLAPDLEALEGALDARAPGAMSDKERAERNVDGYLRGVMARHDVRRGMANDWFRRWGKAIDRSWRPLPGELNDGGEAVSQLGLLSDFLLNPLRWGEYTELYLVEAMAPMMAALGIDHTLRHVPDPSAPTMAGQRDKSEAELRREVMEALGTKRQALRYSATARIRVHHDEKGRVTAIEILTSSGHPRLDEGMREAIARAADVLGEDAPAGVAGQPFTSEWLLDARWQMTPPRCYAIELGSGRGPPMAEGTTQSFLCGQKFDVTRDGVEVERPFEVKLHTDVRLLEVRRLEGARADP